jgi:hypothetical protein
MRVPPPTPGPLDAMMLNITDIETDLRRCVAHVDLSAPDAALQVWHGFLEHAANPIALESPDPVNDVVSFVAERPLNADDRRIVQFQRRVGLETAELGYIGTIVAACYLTVPTGDAWARLPAIVSIGGHGASPPADAPTEEPDLDGFRRAVEASDAFAALTAGHVRDLVVSVSKP